MTDCRIIVHIGFHKTGTSSIQAFLNDCRGPLIERGVFYYTGSFAPSNHVELHCAAMRAGRESPYKVRNGIQPTAEFLATTRGQIAEFLRPVGTFVFSAEGLSYLRHPDEIETLRQLFGGRRIEILAYIRNPLDWLESYKTEIARHPASASPPDDSYSNTQSDSWLLDFDARLEPFRDAFGDDLRVVDYDLSLANDGTVIPSFFRTIGAADFLAVCPDWTQYWKNQRQP